MEDSPIGGPVQDEAKAAAETPPVDAAAGETPVVPSVKAAPSGVNQPKRGSWIRTALVAVSVVALLLLASTITLAVIGDFGGHHGPEAPARVGNQPMGPAQGQGGGGQQRARPGRPGNQDDQGNRQQNNQQVAPPESQSE